MQFTKPEAKSDIEKIFLDQIEKETPEKIKISPPFDLNNKQELVFKIKKEHLLDFYDNKKGFGITTWFENYKKEAKVSTAGIRGVQNPLYPWDGRYPLNLIGTMLATLGKVIVAKEIDGNKTKIAASETRYNSKMYIELISRIQAAYGIETLVTDNYDTIPIFLISFLIFMYDLYGGEYVTSSHAMAKKIATKDLNSEGSQYVPSESLKFVDKVEEILKEVVKKGEYEVKIASNSSKLINKSFLKNIKNGVDLYVEYLRKNIVTSENTNYIRGLKNRVIVDCMGGSMFRTLKPILESLKINKYFNLIHTEEDPFHHGIGKLIQRNQDFFDWGCDTTIFKADLTRMEIKLPVVETVNYENILKKYPTGTTLLMTDPDADRLVTGYIDNLSNVQKIKQIGLAYHILDDDRILIVFTPNQSFLMTFDFQKKSLVKAGLWNKYDWFIIKTTASQLSWDQWGSANNVPVVNTPVGFKEIQDIMMHVEEKLRGNSGKDILIKDVFGQSINIGKNPRLLFAGEESGGEIFGPHEIIKSKKGKIALSMREKSAGEAVIITSAMAGWLEENDLKMADYLLDIFDKNNITAIYEIRIDTKYYNESEPDIRKLKIEKENGIKIRTYNDNYFLSLSLGFKDKIIELEEVKKVLSESFPDLNFKNLIDIKFVGDGNYFLFTDKCVEVRPSGTDAINKAYCYGSDQWECIKYAQAFSSFEGKRGLLHKKCIPEKYYQGIKDYAFDNYKKYKENM